ncbi:hypothetical protein K501DRAFT_297400 [Backusella circina FSU 941]|nr:hypothetical protein K501DRAFT_297400 [Backusella circina FSU 941]
MADLHSPLIRLHRPTIDLSSTFTHIRSIDNTTASLSILQGKLAFLLGVTFHAPKEERKRRLIIKSFIVKAHSVAQWLTRLIGLSTQESRVSLKSIASSLALQAGIPKADIVTLGNWSNLSTFENNYRREHPSHFDFTNTLITLNDEQTNQDDDDTFHDAEDFPLDDFS